MISVSRGVRIMDTEREKGGDLEATPFRQLLDTGIMET
jgi:hypothetical protein